MLREIRRYPVILCGGRQGRATVLFSASVASTSKSIGLLFGTSGGSMAASDVHALIITSLLAGVGRYFLGASRA